MKFYERLRELRKASPFTQKTIADELGISVTAYQYYESCENQPSIENLIKLCDMFNVTLDYLTGRVD